MSSGESVSQWLNQLKAGDHDAAQKLWERYFRRLVGLARKKLQDMPRRAVDEEDVALSAFNSFCQGVERGQFPLLHDREDLWQLLVILTARKAFHLIRDEHRLKRGGGATEGEWAFAALENSNSAKAGIHQVMGREPSPDFAVQVAEESQRLLEKLGDAQLRSIALWKMEGETTEQIARRLGRAPRTVERKLELIRSLWEEETGP